MRAYMVSCPHVRRKVQKWAQKKAPASACNWSHPGPRPTNWLLTATNDLPRGFINN